MSLEGRHLEGDKDTSPFLGLSFLLWMRVCHSHGLKLFFLEF